MRQKHWIVLLLVLLATVVPLTQAQDEMMTHVCDSTLVTLLLVAEHDYGYLSSRMGTEMEVPAIELGEYKPLIDSISAMMQTMEGDDAMGSMSEDEMKAHDAMLAEMMSMDAMSAIAAYMQSMNMAMDDMAEPLKPGHLPDEDPVCAQVRADVQQFILAHILTDMQMMGEGM